MKVFPALVVALTCAAAVRADDPTLQRVKRSQWVKQLLTDQDPDLRVKAAGVVGEMRWFAGPGGAALVKALAEDGYEPVREEAATALGKIADPDLAVPALLAALKDKAAPVRASAARALAEYGSKAAAALPALTARLNDKDETDAALAAVAVARIDPAKDTGLRRLLAIIKDAKEADVRDFALSGLTLEVEPDILRKHAALVAPALVALLKDKADPKDQGVWSQRMTAIAGLGTLGPAAKDAVAVLTAHLADAPQYVRLKAAGSLYRIDPKNADAIKAVVAELKAESPLHRDRFDAREPAMLAAEIGPAAKDAVPELIALLKAGTAIHTQTREAAIYALGRIGPAAKAALPDLTPDLKGKDDHWKFQAAQAVARIDPTNADAVAVLKGFALDPGPTGGADLRMMAFDALAEHPTERAATVRLALAALTDPGKLDKRNDQRIGRFILGRADRLAFIQSGSAAIVARYGTAKEASPALVASLADDNLALRVAAAKALQQLDPDALAKALGKK